MPFSFAHISDVHIGSLAVGRCDAIVDIVKAANPTCVIVSGDNTRRARQYEFEGAKAFYERFSCPTYVIPGNHDVPLYSFWGRLLRPTFRYEQVFGTPGYLVETPEYQILGINTASPWQPVEGRLRASDVARIEQLCASGGDRLKIVVSHHPLPWILKRMEILRLRRDLIERFLKCPVDFYLCGHRHQSVHSFSGDWFSNRYRFQSVFMQAGTATSARYRDENNAFYINTWDGQRLLSKQWLWHAEVNHFVLEANVAFERDAEGWHVIE